MRTTTRRLFDLLMHDVRYACRGVSGAPLAALTLVATIGLGLGLLAVVFTILNSVFFRPDDVHNPQELFAVMRQPSADTEPEGFTREEYDALLRETSIFSDAFATAGEVDRWIDGQRLEGALVTGNFSQVLGVSAERGRALTPSDDVPGSRVIVLSHRAWTRYFASDPDIAGRTVRLNDAPFDVLGVMPESFRGLGFAPPDFWAPLSLRDEFRRNTDGQAFLGIVGRLRPDVSSAQALTRLVAWDTQRSLAASGQPPARSLLLEPRHGTLPLSGGTAAAFVPLFFAFGLILLIGCANVANLLLARGIARQREVGIRLALGASRRRIVVQLLTESLLLALVAAAVGFGVSRSALHAIVYYLTTTLANMGDIRLAVPPADWRVGLFLVFAAIVSTLLFALAPALRSTRFDVARSIHGEVLQDTRPGRVRSGLIALQVTASVLLLICSAIFLRSSWEAAAADPGVRTADTVFLGIGNEQGRGAIVDAARAEPSVAAIAAMSPVVLDVRAETAAGASTATYRFVSPEYFDILGVNLARGRTFAPAERDAIAGVAIVSQSAAHALWPGQDALGQTLRLEPASNDERGATAPTPLPASAFVVVGIAEDVAGFRQGGTRLLAGPDVYLPTTPETPYTALALRVVGDPAAAARVLREELSTVDPNVGEIIPLRELARMEASLLEIPFWLTLVLGGLALFLTLSGLFSVLSYLIEQRTREIGVRIALGATRKRISMLVLTQSIRPVGIGLVLGSSLVAALGAALLATPAAELIGSGVRLFDPVAYAASLLLVAAACGLAALAPVLRAMRVDPITALRRD
jgi:predicted permease